MSKTYTTPTLVAQGDAIALTRYVDIAQLVDASGNPTDREFPLGSLGFSL
jgi:hypothetical protein